MADQRILVSATSLESTRAYIEAAKSSLGSSMTLQSNAAVADLNRALECLDEAPLLDSEL